MDGTGRGRGRGATLPAWMTQGKYTSDGSIKPAQPAGVPSTAPAAATPQATPNGTAPPAAAKPTWTEHTAPDGRKYYYNATTKQSVWVKPDELKAAEAAAAAAKAAAAAPSAAPPAATIDWTEHTAPDGRKYYYSKTLKKSVWTMPEEMKRAREAAGAAATPTGAATPATTPAAAATGAAKAPAAGGPPAAGRAPAGAPAGDVRPPLVGGVGGYGRPPMGVAPAGGMGMMGYQLPGMPPVQDNTPLVFSSREEAKDAFKSLLRSVGCASTWTWEQAFREIAGDRRYGALKTLGEKKACFNEYLQQRKREEKDEARQRLIQSREDFIAMLEGCVQLTAASKFSKARDILEGDPRWQAVEARTREELFTDYIKERDKREREARRAEAKRRQDAFRAIVKESNIPSTTSWRKAQARFEHTPEFQACEKVERLEVFAEHIKGLERAEREVKEQERHAQKRQARLNRDAFRQLLELHVQEGRITAKTTWKEYGRSVDREPAYQAVALNLTGSTPRELFEDVLETLEVVFEKHYKVVGEVVKALDLAQQVVNMEDGSALRHILLEALRSEEQRGVSEEQRGVLEEMPLLPFDVFVEEMHGRAAEARAKEERRAKRAADDFATMLRRHRAVHADMTWEDGCGALSGEPEWGAVHDEKQRRVLFEEAIGRLQAKRSKRKKDDSDNDSGDRRKHSRRKKHKKDSRKKHKRHRSDSPGSSADSGRPPAAAPPDSPESGLVVA